jgi:saccharopine dehydrogenase-like NADP-dependent oxidoreductase
MKKILVLGAGLSSASLIQYLLKNARKENWEITVADSNLDAAKIRIGRNKAGKAITLDILDENKRSSIVKKSNLVISLLPPSLHHLVAFNCIEARIPMITASYVSEEMKKLHPLALKAGVLLLNEIGLDPGIDHMSAMEMIHNVQKKGGKITSLLFMITGVLCDIYSAGNIGPLCLRTVHCGLSLAPPIKSNIHIYFLNYK